MLAISHACSPPTADSGAPDVTVSVQIEPTPPIEGAAQIQIALCDDQGRPVEAARVMLEANMNHAGMVPVLSEGAETDSGRFSTEIEFTMAGDWFLLVEATLRDGRRLQRTIDVPGVRWQ